jgi:hypothetical protein
LRRLAAAVAVLCLPLPARAYVRAQVNGSGPWLFWATRGHSFLIDARGTPDVPSASAFDAVRKSFATWAAVSCSDLSFSEEGPPAPTDRRVGYVSGQTNHNLVLWREQSCSSAVPAGDPCLTQGGCSNKYDCWEHDSGAIATTTTTSITTTGEILDADIELNGSAFVFTAGDGPTCNAGGPYVGCVAYDVQNTVTHEAGHYLGLAHSSDTMATMYAFAPIGEVSKRDLHTDDIQGICTIYPKGGLTSVSPGVTPPGPAKNAGGGCASAPRAPSWEALLLVAALAAFRRRARSSADRRSAGASPQEPEG